MFQSRRIDEFGAGRAALRKVLLDSNHHKEQTMVSTTADIVRVLDRALQ
jgi:hypothetical protein